MRVAHVLAPSGVPGFVGWVAAAATAAGVVTVLAARRREVRSVAMVAALLGAGATVTLWVLQPSAPSEPGLRIAITVASPPVTSPVAFRVCPRRDAGGSPLGDVVSGGRLLSVSVDGSQVTEGSTSSLAVPMADGNHRLRVELLTSDHRAYAPPIADEVVVTVSGPAPLRSVAPCPRSPA